MAHCEREVWNSETGICMTHQRAQNQLHVHGSRREGTECLNRNAVGVGFDERESSLPAWRSEHRQSNHRSKKRLRETCMKRRNPKGQQKTDRENDKHARKNDRTQGGRHPPSDTMESYSNPDP